MPLFTAKARPRLTRSATSMKKKEREMYMYMYLLALALLLVVSVTIVHFLFGRSSAHPAQDAKHVRKGASGAENLLVSRHKSESRIPLSRREKYKEAKDANRKKLAETFYLSKERRTRSADKRGSGSRWIEEGEGESNGEEVQYLSDVDGRKINLNNQDVEEFESGNADEEINEIQAYKVRMFQGQQLDDMDKFDSDEVADDVYKHQGQLLEDMDKFDNHRVAVDTIKRHFEDDGGPKFMQDLSELRGIERNRKYHMVGQSRAGKQAEGRLLVIEDDTRGHVQDGKKDSRKFGFRGDSVKDERHKEREDGEQERFDKIVGSVAGQLGSENRSLTGDTIKRTYEAAKGSIRAAIEQEMKRRNGVFWRENSMGVRQGSNEQAGDAGRLNFGETNPEPSFSYVKTSAEKASLVKIVETGIPPLRGFREFSDNMKNSLNNPRDSQRREADIVDLLSLPNVKENTVDIMLSSGAAQELADVHNVGPTNALAIGEKASMSKQFDHDEKTRVNVEESPSENHLTSADVMQSDKQLIEDLNNVEVIQDKVEGKSESERSSEGDSAMEENGNEEEVKSKKTNEEDSAVEEKEDDDHDNTIQWGFYPTLSSNLKFSKFLSAFFKQGSCSLRIFMAWTTAPWAYTPRHQRAIESILHFHPQACIVVFTETIDFQFFESWVKEGYKIAVARPNLEDLLGQTPAIDFAYVWYEWRNVNLFYIHYTELLRIAALHKYGGVWLDMDIILARPLPKLHNVLGSTVSESGEWALNGAFMSFDKSSPFLKACIEEFVATYDETSLRWNGADLLNRVAANATRKGGKEWLEESEHLQILEPIAFFPLSRHNILRYFSAPKNSRQRAEQEKMLSAILDESYGTHLWNSVTRRRVPEVGSLVEKLLNRNCMRCTDIL